MTWKFEYCFFFNIDNILLRTLTLCATTKTNAMASKRNTTSPTNCWNGPKPESTHDKPDTTSRMFPTFFHRDIK